MPQSTVGFNSHARRSKFAQSKTLSQARVSSCPVQSKRSSNGIPLFSQLWQNCGSSFQPDQKLAQAHHSQRGAASTKNGGVKPDLNFRCLRAISRLPTSDSGVARRWKKAGKQ